MRRTIEVGFLFSTDGTYKRMGQHGLAGATHALAEINRNHRYDFQLKATHFNPQGYLQRYNEGAVAMMESGIRHLFGTTTSASRKEIIPDLEQNASLLWYACPYEGFESSENVLYLGGCPNQTLIPLLRYALGTFGKRAMLVGSNYIWGWESNRIAREVLQAAHGDVIGEKYIHLGSTNFTDLIQFLLTEQPAFILNNLVGESSYAFLQQLDAACVKEELTLPVLSCNLTEAELAEVGEMQNLRLLSCGPFFESVDSAFTQRQLREHGQQPCSHYYTGTYVAIHLFAEALHHVGSAAPADICQYLYAHAQDSVLGRLKISGRNNHSSLPCHIAEYREGRFVVLHSEPHALSADPYLTSTDLREFHRLRALAALPHLRIVK
ncbi:transporter substrate-binding protein [Pseudomonas sp. DWP3-1-2]|uniref:transporter substrate-binding protein n=1 Tax=Pseudomonas sp. DWP3-1-2 TaxID=2804645 RepID=UPI003CF49F57